MSWTDILPPMLIPFVMSTILLALALSLRLFWPLAPTLSVTYVATHIFLTRFPPFPPVSADEWLVFAALLASPLALLDRALPRRRLTAPILWTAFPITLFWLSLGARRGLLFAALLGLSTGLAITLAQTFHIPDEEEENKPSSRASTLLILTTSSFATAAILLLGASLRLAMLATSLSLFALALTTVLAISIALKRRPKSLRLEPLFPLYFILLTGLLTSGVLFAKTPFLAALFIALALITGLALRHRSPLLSIFFGLLFSAAAVGFTYYDLKIATPPPPAQGEYDPYSW